MRRLVGFVPGPPRCNLQVIDTTLPWHPGAPTELLRWPYRADGMFLDCTHRMGYVVGDDEPGVDIAALHTSCCQLSANAITKGKGTFCYSFMDLLSGAGKD